MPGGFLIDQPYFRLLNKKFKVDPMHSDSLPESKPKTQLYPHALPPSIEYAYWDDSTEAKTLGQKIVAWQKAVGSYHEDIDLTIIDTTLSTADLIQALAQTFDLAEESFKWKHTTFDEAALKKTIAEKAKNLQEEDKVAKLHSMWCLYRVRYLENQIEESYKTIETLRAADPDRVLSQRVEFSDNENAEKPLSLANIFHQEVYTGTLIYFHGGPGQAFEAYGYQALIHLVTKTLGLRLVAVEIAGAKQDAIESLIDDSNPLVAPNYVAQISGILDYLKANDANAQQADNSYVALAHSFGCYQLFNYLRFMGKRSGFDKVIASGGIYNIGAFFVAGALRRSMLDSPLEDPYFIQHNLDKIQPALDSNIRMYNNSVNPPFSKVHCQPIHNPLENLPLNQALSPFSHVAGLPENVRYLIHVTNKDEYVHASQSIDFFKLMHAQNLKVQLLFTIDGCHDLITKLENKDSRDFLRLDTKKRMTSDLPELKDKQKTFFDNMAFFIKEDEMPEGNTLSVEALEALLPTLQFVETGQVGREQFVLKPYMDWNAFHIALIEHLKTVYDSLPKVPLLFSQADPGIAQRPLDETPTNTVRPLKPPSP